MDNPHAATIDGKLFAYGPTLWACRTAFLEQIAGGDAAMKRRLLARVVYEPLTDEQASEAAECIAAQVMEWTR